MIEQHWEEYIDNCCSFSYQFTIPVSGDGFKEDILNFDALFLSAGNKMGIFKYAEDDLINKYISRREQSFFNNNRQWVRLVDLEQFEDTSIKNMFILLPERHGKLVPVSYHQPFINSRYLELEVGSHFHWSELSNLEYWYEEISISIESHSTIWWEAIDLKLDGNGYPHDINPPVDNRFFAYRITPRFNSFLRDVRNKIEELGGSVTLDIEHNKKYATEEGILLDNRIIYQEDIDAGKIDISYLS